MGTIQENVSGQSTEASKKKTDNKENDTTRTETNFKQNHTSMSSLIVWNISKALERKPCMDLKSGIRTAQERLLRVSREGNTTISQYPEEEHLVCALLAWQQLGHARADSLYEFIASKKIADNPSKNSNNNKPVNTVIVTSNSFNIHCNDAKSLKGVDSLRFRSYSNGPVVKLPVETKIIMRMDQTSRNPKIKCTNCKIQNDLHVSSRESRYSARSTDTTYRINAACCMESACSETLAKMDAETAELRSRAEKLAKREAQRSELLERAEAAWKELERGYQRRLTLAQEKEEDITRQIQKTMDDRNEFKKSCNALAQELKDRGDVAEEDRNILKSVEAEVCHYACQRLKLNEEMTRVEAALAEQQCKTVQLQRDLQFKEEQVRRKVMTMESETESARALTHETERALRAELSALREQINQVSNQLLEEDKANKELKKELEDLRQEKMGMIEDLDGCKAMCDGKIKKQMDELQAKRQQLQELKDKEIECRCRLPVDAAVEVKRTPSLAALCRCSPEDRIMDACSCTSMKGRLLSNLLADLFGGLQSELGGTGSQMPCQLLKCLEDQHNWDRASVTKANLRNYFSKLLIGELDIAIATSIENYHAKWVGTSCADDKIRMTPGPQDDLKEGWEKRAIERRAQKLAAQLAEELYEKRAEELTKRAKTIVTSGPPPCECNKQGSQCAYPCLLEPVTPFSAKVPEVARKGAQSDKSLSPPPPAYWKRTHKDVTQLRLEIEDLKKDSIKKEDLKLMEEKIAKIVKKTAGPEAQDIATKDNADNQNKYKKESKHTRNTNTDDFLKNTSVNKSGVIGKKSFDIHNYAKKTNYQEKPTKQTKRYNYHQTYAVNMCLCPSQKPNKITQNNQSNINVKGSAKQKSLNIGPSLGADNQTNDTDINNLSPDADIINKNILAEPYCSKDCKCFHKVPSNTSIDKLLETLTKWKSDLGKSDNEPANNVTIISKSCINKSSKSILKNKNQIDSKAHCLEDSNKEVNQGVINKKQHEADKLNHSINFHDAAKTVSEYMAAVNLDKSNEYSFKYADVTESCKNFKELEKNISRCSNPFSCLNSVNYRDPVIRGEKLNESKDAEKILNEHLYDKMNNTNIINILTNSKSTRAINTEEIRQEAVLKDTVDKKKYIQNHTKILSNKLDYYVKFLGVTLVDNKFQKAKNSIRNYQDKSSLCKAVYKNSLKGVSKLERQKSETPKSEISKSSRDMNKYPMADPVTNFSNRKKKCECKAKFDEFKKIIIGMFNDQVKNKNSEQRDKALDSQSLTYQIDSLGSCVCCNKKHADCSDLEQNAFDLLEAHLKEKIKEFKICSCHSSCFSAEEEEKIFRTILKRVKQVISDCANELKYNENGNLLCTSEGSWQRAYGLLQEYLKMKVKRAQCLPLLNEDKDVVLPGVLQKVCDLIESDFQRLKDMCKCEKKNKLFTRITLVEPLLEPYKELPEKDNPNDTITSKKLTQPNSIQRTILTETESSQVRSKGKMETKSCDPRSDAGMVTKSCDAMVKDINMINVVSTQNSTNALTQSMSTQVPLDLGMSTKSCNVTFKENNKISKENLTEYMLIRPEQYIYSQLKPGLGMDTKSCDTMIKADKIVRVVSRINIPDSIYELQHMSSQVPPNLGMESKCCDAIVNRHDINIIESADCIIDSSEALHIDRQSYGITETDSERKNINTIRAATTKTPKQLIYNTCNCNYSPKDTSPQDYNTTAEQYNICADFLLSSYVQHIKQNIDPVQIKALKNTKSLPNFENITGIKQQPSLKNIKNDGNIHPKNVNVSEPPNNIPYIGSTIDCICDSNFKSCTCIKSIIQDSNCKISNNWKEFLAHNNKCTKNFPYIMNGKQNKSHDIFFYETLYNIPLYNDNRNNFNIFTSHSKELPEEFQHSSNICEKITNLVPDSDCKGPLNWVMCPQSEKSQTRLTTATKQSNSNSAFYFEPVDDTISSCKSFNATKAISSTDKIADCLYYDPITALNCSRKSVTTSDTSKGVRLSQNNCNCDKVPLCHVKMLVDNIERNLIESKCTCDSVFKLCPVHRKKFR